MNEEHANVRKTLTSITLLLAIAVVPLGVSVWLSVRTQNWSWVVRSGSFLMIGGVLLILRKLIRLGFRGIVNEVWVRNGGSVEPHSIFGHHDSYEQRLDRIALLAGAFLAIAGLFLWAYGDFIYM